MNISRARHTLHSFDPSDAALAQWLTRSRCRPTGPTDICVSVFVDVNHVVLLRSVPCDRNGLTSRANSELPRTSANYFPMHDTATIIDLEKICAS